MQNTRGKKQEKVGKSGIILSKITSSTTVLQDEKINPSFLKKNWGKKNFLSLRLVDNFAGK